jgi:hypothetical protein
LSTRENCSDTEGAVEEEEDMDGLGWDGWMGRIVNTTVDVMHANVYHECCVYNYEG